MFSIDKENTVERSVKYFIHGLGIKHFQSTQNTSTNLPSSPNPLDHQRHHPTCTSKLFYYVLSPIKPKTFLKKRITQKSKRQSLLPLLYPPNSEWKRHNSLTNFKNWVQNSNLQQKLRQTNQKVYILSMHNSTSKLTNDIINIKEPK